MPPLMIAALVASVAGKIGEGVEANSAARAQARVDDENARLTVLQGEQEALATARDERRVTGDLLAAMGGSGFEMGSGTMSDLIAANALEREREMLNIRTARTREANNLRQRADDGRRAGRGALVQSLFGAVSTGLSVASDNRRDNLMRAQAGRERTTILQGSPIVPPMRMGG